MPKPHGWPIERITGLVAGVVVLLTLGLGRLHTGRWRVMTGWVGVNLVLNAMVGWCPLSVVLRRAGIPLAAEQGGSCRA
ncbi:DUF2892 domain-containing protein [Mycobacterium sp. M1]|uniref:DUF2892 domain-containing protein n=1 Tax=Mycolicibacter acidiphilus TaxID=2835306 RepID=A0ABS5RK63_9MYCO|nr:DUF2892 domain-containing protein [Mycolicibacter acidiphilus]MBS9534682.1 DUF2892 domain-containing protein [Mycolicibacter acidiphilus]